MFRSGIVDLALHGGQAPKWLFQRMVDLCQSITEFIILEYGLGELMRRLSDPFWFQSLSCALGFDWHSSGTTTVTCGALKKALKANKHGIAVAGGKGRVCLKTPQEIKKIGNDLNLSNERIEKLIYTSRMAAKIDNTAIQDGHNLYHHVFLLTEHGEWAVIQQGLNKITNYARRYHWFSENFNNFTTDPQNGIFGIKNNNAVLNMVSKKSIQSQRIAVDLVKDNPNNLRNDWIKISNIAHQKNLDNWLGNNDYLKNYQFLTMPRNINWDKMKEIYEFQPKDYEELLSIYGVGPNTVRALALISELVYGEKPSWSDPVKFSFAVGGKDGVPYPIDREAMDESIRFLKIGIDNAKIRKYEKLRAIKRINILIHSLN
jgi:hypothetical protein